MELAEKFGTVAEKADKVGPPYAVEYKYDRESLGPQGRQRGVAQESTEIWKFDTLRVK